MLYMLRSIEIYESAQGGFDGWAASKCFGNFLIVFFGSFALGSCMGCVTALVSFSLFRHDQ